MTKNMGSYYKVKFIEKVNISIALRNWDNLPASFQHDVVKFRYEEMKGYFGKSEIKQRIAASKAETFTELLDAINQCLD